MEQQFDKKKAVDIGDSNEEISPLTAETTFQKKPNESVIQIILPRFSVYFGFGHISIIDRENQ